MKAFKNGDVEKMLSTFAIETYVKNFDYEEYTEYSYTYSYNHVLPGKDGDSYQAGVNKYLRVSKISEIFRNQFLVLNGLDDKIEEGVNVFPPEEKETIITSLWISLVLVISGIIFLPHHKQYIIGTPILQFSNYTNMNKKKADFLAFFSHNTGDTFLAPAE